jgi:hypothetical protein
LLKRADSFDFGISNADFGFGFVPGRILRAIAPANTLTALGCQLLVPAVAGRID